MRLLLVNPRYPESFWSFRWAIDRVLPGKRAINPPLGLATLAALTPPHWQVEIVDENVESVPLEPRADLVGVCGMAVQFPRQKELLAYYRRAGYRTVAGGSYASLCPELYGDIADCVVAGEAEYAWGEFCADWEQGRPRRLYRETRTVSLADSPAPRFDLLKLDRYTTATLQFSRGCPFRCDFCDIIVMFGRIPRHKAVAQIARELDALRRLGASNVFFVDDNLIGNKAVAKELLGFLADYQERHGRPFQFGAQVSLNVAHDPALLRLLQEANFGWVFIGIESPDPEALKHTRKTQNLQQDILTCVRRIYAHGIDVLGGFIVGFDTDTTRIFDAQLGFIMRSGIQAAMVGLLTALPRTPLYARLEKEGRLRAAADSGDNTRPATNIVPKGMSYDELVDGYQRLLAKLAEDRNIAGRIRTKLKYLRSPAYRGEYGLRQRLGIVWKLVTRGVLPGGPRRIVNFLRSLPWLAPRKLPIAVMDWIAGLALRDYLLRRFPAPVKFPAAIDRIVAAMRAAVARYAADGRVVLKLRRRGEATFDLLVCVRGWLDRALAARAARHLKRFLERTPFTITLQVQALRAQDFHHFHRLLSRLARYGDRVVIVLDEHLRPLLPVDSSVFGLSLGSRTD
ncbi:MAG: B12-binding domain-containing radical SAM protein [Betaproteobacteria bacterium]|nr:B12-binding domain-containing radical SAM protein [Betaproteobacteria bacterium]